jgi:two-component system cell cycle response regulator
MDTSTQKKILVLEDEHPMAKALEIKLSHAGFKVTTVFNGEDALEMLAKEPHDLIMCDLIMPKMDGFQFMEELRARNITTPVVVMTNLSQDEDRARAEKLGARGFIVKSNTPIADIVATAQSMLAS